jgi:tetratricopeptide (TPR) repeat protein
LPHALRDASRGEPSESGVRPSTRSGLHGAERPIVGRQLELEAMRNEVGQTAIERAARFLLVTGPAGIGKSRLFSELVRDTHGRDPNARFFKGIAGRGTFEHPHGPLVSLFRNRLGIRAVDTAARAEQLLTEQLAEMFSHPDALRIGEQLRAWIGLSRPATPRAETDPGLLEGQLLAFLAFLRRDAVDSPIVLGFENLHTAPPESWGAIRFLVNELGDRPVLVVGLARPEHLDRARLIDFERARIHRLEVGPMTAADSEALVREMFRRVDPVPDLLVSRIVEQAGGNPFFVEEISRVLIERGAVDNTTSPWTVNLEKVIAMEIPGTLVELVRARVVALSPEERKVLTRAAAIGTHFWLGLLVAIERRMNPDTTRRAVREGYWGQDRERREVARTLQLLQAKGFVAPSREPMLKGDEEFLFVQMRERELFAESSVDVERSIIHAVTGVWLESRLSAARIPLETEAAYHLAAGGESERAALLYLRAGDVARDRYDQTHASALYRRGIELLDRTPSLVRIDALHSLGTVETRAGRYAEAHEAFGEMLSLAWMLDLKSKGGAAYARIGRIYRLTGDYDQATTAFDRALVQFREASDRRGVASTLDDVGRMYWLKGTTDEALRLYRDALAIRRELGDRRSLAVSLHNLGVLEEERGEIQGALSHLKEALEIRREVGDREGVVATLNAVALVYEDVGRGEEAIKMLEESLKIAREIGDKAQEALLLNNLGDVSRERGDSGRARVFLDQAMTLANELGDRRVLAEAHRSLAELRLSTEGWERAAAHAEAALALAEEQASRPLVASALRVLGVVCAARERAEAAGVSTGGAAGKAVDNFKKAADMLEELGMRDDLAKCLKAWSEHLKWSGDEEGAQELAFRARALRNAPRLREAIESADSLS